jgi:8-oxo-dGTP pyrophosphatase MutT (NUDIX family)
MATPDFIIALREKIGTDPLWLSGVTAVVLRGSDVLLVKRADSGAWTPVTGIIDPGEEPAFAAVREVEEEAGVTSVVDRLAWVRVTEPVIYPNGDESQYLDLVFRLTWTGGEPTPADGENTEARWFPLDHLPEISGDMRARIAAAVEDRPDTRFQAPGR